MKKRKQRVTCWKSAVQFLGLYLWLGAWMGGEFRAEEAVPLAEDISFSVPLWDHTGAKAMIGQGGAGQALAGGAPVVEESKTWAHLRYLATGKTDQALAYPAGGNLDSQQWSLSFCVIGKNWDVNGKETDVFFRFEGKEATVQLTRSQGSGGAELQLTLQRGKGTPVTVKAPLTAAMAMIHQIMITCGEGQARIYLDAKPIGAGRFSTEGLNFDRIIFGQAGPGGAENRLMNKFTIYKRALSAGEVARAWHHESRIALRRSATILKTNRKITLDGEVNEDEWRDATEITGLVVWGGEHFGSRLLAKEQTRFYVTYDDANLYVAMISPTPDKVKNDPHMTAGMGGLLKTTKGGHDTDVDADDVFETDVVIPQRDGDLYRYVVNGINTTYDYTVGGYSSESVLKGIDINWEPMWQVVANKVDMEKGWRAEARLPFSDIKAPAPKPGVSWGMNFKRYWKQYQVEIDAWVAGERLDPDRQLISGAYAHGVPGLVTFGGAEGAAVQLDGIGRPDNGQLKLTGRVVNTAKENRRVKLSLTSDSGEVGGEKVLDVPAGGLAPFELGGRIKQFTTNRLLFNAEDNGQNIYTMEIPVFLRQALEIASRSYPTPGVFKVEMDVTGLSDIPVGELSSIVELKDKKSGKVAATQKIAKFASYHQDARFDVKKLPVGLYEARAAIRRGDKVLITKTLPFNKQPMPEWFGNQVGISDQVPPPFKPIRVTNDVARVWGREYQFKDGLLPQQIVVLGKNLLREPIHLQLTASDGKVLSDDKVKAGVNWTKTSDTRAECARAIQLGDYTLENKFWMEYDGFIWNTLTVTSAKKQPLKGLKLIIPFTKEFSDVINPYDYSLRSTGKLRPEGWSGKYRPVWVGNAVGGLQWLAESDGDWNVSDPAREVVVRNDHGTATMEITFVDQATNLDPPLPLPFGLVATPVKESDRANRNGPIRWEYAAYPPGELFMPGAKGWYRKSPDDNGFILDHQRGDYAVSKNFSKRDLKHYTGPYVTTELINADTPDFKQFGDEWYTSETDRQTENAPVSQASRSFQDYFVWQYWKLYQNNPFAALYYDVSNESNGMNPLGGTGYRKRDGSWVPSQASLGARAVAKRLYTMIKLRHPDAMIKYHNSGLVNMAFMAFCDYFVEGECTINMLTQDKPDYLGKIRPDTYRAEMMGRNFGFVTDFLYQFTRSGMWTYDSMRKDGKGQYAVDHILGIMMLHDCNMWDSYAPHEFATRLYRALQRHGWGANYKMIPYWNQKIVAMPENQFATFYVDDFTDKAICIFYNDTTAKGAQQLKPDWSKLGFKDLSRLKLENTGHELTTYTHGNPAIWHDYKCDYRPNPAYTVRIENGGLEMSLMPYDYQMVVIWQE
ncbi:MAG: hypothetical protein HY360_02090 [Verrucomicrobia bacterium]|nr:hypothetical protein [Verrucomicrobiota bacterium]